MLNKLSFLTTLLLLVTFALGCDDNRSNSFVYDANTVPGNPVIGTLPNPGGGGAGGGGAGGGGAGGGGAGGGGVATLTFIPTSPLDVTIGGADATINAAGTPAGGSISLSNIVTGGTGGTFTGPTGLTFDFTTSTTTTAGTATVDVTYTPPPPDLPVTLTYTVNVSGAATTLSYTTAIPVSIPDGTGFMTPGLPAISTIDTNAGGATTTTSITDVRVLVNITIGSFRGDLGFFLTSPNGGGNTVQLYDFNAAAGAADLRVIFDDTAISSVSAYTSAAVPAAPFSGYPSFNPISALSTATPSGFGGEDANGVWSLTVFDYYSGFGTGGVLNEWGLAFDGDVTIF